MAHQGYYMSVANAVRDYLSADGYGVHRRGSGARPAGPRRTDRRARPGVLFAFTLSYDEFSRTLFASGRDQTLPLAI